MGILDKLKRIGNSRAKTVSDDLSRLDELKKGLGDKAAAYVLDGSNETVLSTVSNLRQDNELNVGIGGLSYLSPTWARRALLARQDPLDAEFTVRYTRLLSAACGDLPDGTAGTGKAARDVRVLFSEIFGGVNKQPNTYPEQSANLRNKGVTLSAAIDLTKAVGGTVVDLVDVLYNEGPYWSAISGTLYREAVGGVAPLLKAHANDVTAAGRQLGAPGRAALIQDIFDCKMLGIPEYQQLALELAGDSSRKVREIACSVLGTLPAEQLEPLAIEALANGKVNTRIGMVELLAGLGTDSALAALAEHKTGKEKTARVLAAIDTAMTVAEQPVSEIAAGDDETGYQAFNGERIEIPPEPLLDDGERVKFGAADKAELVAIIDKENESIRRAAEEAKKRGYKYRPQTIKQSVAETILSLFNSGQLPRAKRDYEFRGFLNYGAASKWARAAADRMPEKQALQLSSLILGGTRGALQSYAYGVFAERIRDYLLGPKGDVRLLENMDVSNQIETRLGYGPNYKPRKTKRGDFLRYFLDDDSGYRYSHLEAPDDALWPYIAVNLDTIDEAVGMRPKDQVDLSRTSAIRLLSRLPQAPARYFGALLEAATGETKAGRAEARHMLRDAPNVTEHIINLLDDSRQAIRAGAAEWIADRHETDATPALKKRLKKEKSEIAKAAILTALDSLGEDLSGFVGPKALLEEAETGLKKAKFDKLDWMALDHLPAVHYPGNRRVPEEVLKWWLFLAVKLKQPGGNALFDIYMGRLKPEDAEAFSTWILDSWINYDTAKPSEAEANAYAKPKAEKQYWYYKKHLTRYYPNYTLEQALEDIKRGFMANYLNSGAATKGLLALSKHATPAVAADRVRAYLKNHGKRTSQASSLLEVLAAKGDPVSLQVVIAAATRLKQKGVQKFAGSLIEKVAEAKNWSMDELADRTVPSAGLDDDGTLTLACGPEEKVYTARLDDSLLLTIQNPDGKTVKSLPSGQDDATKAAKKQLSASRRELKQVVAMQTSRLYEALCAGRTWPIVDWQRDLYEHPVMRKLVERSVWLGLGDDGQTIGEFRPTAEGDFTDASDEDVDISAFSSVRLAYGAEMPEESGDAWGQHLDDYEVKPLFTQFGRKLLKLEESQEKDTEIADRKGWVTDTFTFRGAATKLGYERGEAMDAGFFNEYLKSFQSAGVVAVVEFSGNCLPEENVPAAMLTLKFERYSSGKRLGGTLKLSEVPPVLLSECWNDYRSIVANGAFDENWEKKMPWM
ncbi:MAG: DUF4132 domain-containing protein [Woeseiaceae bacterium]|nr:DUF4132 domain-containing protein [Woeseiaceae bacterium]